MQPVDVRRPANKRQPKGGDKAATGWTVAGPVPQAHDEMREDGHMHALMPPCGRPPEQRWGRPPLELERTTSCSNTEAGTTCFCRRDRKPGPEAWAGSPQHTREGCLHALTFRI